MPTRDQEPNSMSHDCLKRTSYLSKDAQLLTQTHQSKINFKMAPFRTTICPLQGRRIRRIGVTGTKNTQSGFGYVSLFILVQVLFVMCVGLASFMVQLERQKSNLALCRIEVLKIQDEILQRVNQLQSFNMVAKLLRVKKIANIAALALAATTGNLPAVARLTREQYQIDQQQKGIDSMQKAILMSISIYHMSSINSLSQKIRLKLSQKLSSVRKNQNNVGLHIVPSHFRLAIKREPENSSEKAPIYLFDEKKANLQRVGIRWRYFDGDAMASFVQNKEWSEQFCEASPRKENQKWISALNPDKFSLKLFYF